MRHVPNLHLTTSRASLSDRHRECVSHAAVFVLVRCNHRQADNMNCRSIFMSFRLSSTYKISKSDAHFLSITQLMSLDMQRFTESHLFEILPLQTQAPAEFKSTLYQYVHLELIRSRLTFITFQRGEASSLQTLRRSSP